MFRPLNDSVVVEPLKAPEGSKGGLVLPEGQARQNYHGLRAVVVAVGPGPWTIQGTRLPMDLKEGDVVILRNAGPLINEAGRVYCVVSERDVMAVVEPSSPGVPADRRAFVVN